MFLDFLESFRDDFEQNDNVCINEAKCIASLSLLFLLPQNFSNYLEICKKNSNFGGFTIWEVILKNFSIKKIHFFQKPTVDGVFVRLNVFILTHEITA